MYIPNQNKLECFSPPDDLHIPAESHRETEQHREFRVHTVGYKYGCTSEVRLFFPNDLDWQEKVYEPFGMILLIVFLH